MLKQITKHKSYSEASAAGLLRQMFEVVCLDMRNSFLCTVAVVSPPVHQVTLLIVSLQFVAQIHLHGVVHRDIKVCSDPKS